MPTSGPGRELPANVQRALAGGALSALANHFHGYAVSKGFYRHETLRCIGPVTGDVEGRPRNPSMDAEKFALMHSEISEALSAWRDDDMQQVALEMGDTLIRVLDYMAWRGMTPETILRVIIQRNQTRPFMHGRVR